MTVAVGTRLDSLTSLRFVAAALVVGYHCGDWQRGEMPAVAHALLRQGSIGVSFFFVLSGFVLAWTHGEADRRSAFYRRRFARIYPAYLAAWIGAALFDVAFAELRPISLAALTLLQAWSPDEATYFAGLAIFWTLSCEAFFYALFPFLVDRLARLEPRSMARLLWALAALHIAIVLAVASCGLPRSLERWWIVIFPPFRLIEFAIGLLLALLIRRDAWPRIPLGLAGAFLSACYLVAGLAPPALMRTSVTLVAMVLLIGAAAHRDLSARPSILNAGAFVRLGTWSYALYLIHPLVLACYRLAIPLRGGWIALVDASIGLALSLAAAAALYRLIERPFETLLRGGRRPAIAVGLLAALAIGGSAPAEARPFAGRGPRASAPLVIGESFTLASRTPGEVRRINVYRPPSATGSTAPLPVLYMPDGGMAEDFLHIAGLIQVSVGLACHFEPMPEERHATLYHPTALRAFRALFGPGQQPGTPAPGAGQ